MSLTGCVVHWEGHRPLPHFPKDSSETTGQEGGCEPLQTTGEGGRRCSRRTAQLIFITSCVFQVLFTLASTHLVKSSDIDSTVSGYSEDGLDPFFFLLLFKCQKQQVALQTKTRTNF